MPEITLNLETLANPCQCKCCAGICTAIASEPVLIRGEFVNMCEPCASAAGKKGNDNA